MDLVLVIYLSIVTFIGFLIQGLSGFGAAIFSLPFALIFLSIEQFVPVSLAFSIAQCLYIALTDRKLIKWKELSIILGLAFLGMPLGVVLVRNLSETILKNMLAIYVLVSSIIKLYRIYSKSHTDGKISKLHFFLPFASGCLQSAFGVGGPLIVSYTSRVITEKRQFRAVLCAFWCVLNSIILFEKMMSGVLSFEHVKMFLYLLPSMAIGTFVGNKLIHKISQEKFTKIVYFILIFSSLMLFL